jgi:hypothetical protein
VYAADTAASANASASPKHQPKRLMSPISFQIARCLPRFHYLSPPEYGSNVEAEWTLDGVLMQASPKRRA